MFFTPGEPARSLVGSSATEEEVAEVRKELGLDKPFFVQYFNYLRGIIFRFDLGTSYITKEAVSSTLVQRLPVTLSLAAFATAFAVMVGIPAGVVSAVRQYSWVDYLVMSIALIGVSMPTFWLGLMLILLFAVTLGWLPVSGWAGPSTWILPMIAVGSCSAAVIARMTRSSMLDVIKQDYIRTIDAKGQKKSVTIWRYALKNASVPILTVIGLEFGFLMCGAVVAEAVFSIPGLGQLMLNSISNRDYPVVQGGVLLIAFIFSAINLLIDIIYAFIDPRIRSKYKESRFKVMHKSVKKEITA